MALKLTTTPAKTAGANRMQQVQFKNMEEMLAFLPDDERSITVFLDKIVLSCLPGATVKLSYNVPYYKVHKNICFIWPASVLWGTKKTYDGVRLGFTCGYLLQDEINWLDKGTRKQVYWKDFTNIKQIDTGLLRSYIFDAASVDEQMAAQNVLKRKATGRQ